ncbi:MAG TPA: MraY family glycosyltransferase [Pseudogracilibacillus sp.]|nr:MraY family glycosyltransferase [Pseudogracilibacillus sp.]
MFNYLEFIIAIIMSALATFILTFFVRELAIKFKFMDVPDYRKIHKNPTPRIGGLAIYLGFLIGLLYLQPSNEHMPAIIVGSLIIVITGALDDKYSIRPIVKLTGQTTGAGLLVLSGLVIDRVTLPIIGMVDLGFFGIILTLLWIVGITNAINLIDGLDGLATGVSTIALLSMFFMAIIQGQVVAAYLSIALVGSNLGFLYHNFHPAKIYMGDTGSNFLGYMIAVISILGLFKNIALFSFIIPVTILAVPIFDTLFAIVRRAANQQKIMAPDNKHIHYQLLHVGFTHRQSVLIMYAFSLVFGVLAIVSTQVSMITTLIITLFVIGLLYILAEMSGLIRGGERPVVDYILRIMNIKKK